MKQNNSNYLFPLLGILCAILGTGALLARVDNDGTLLVWGLLLLAANAFFAAATVGGTQEQVVKVPNRHVGFGDSEPDMVEKTMHRIPLYPMFLALAAGVGIGFYTGSALDGLLTLFTWGGFGYPLAHCILRRQSFGFSLQIGLLSSAVCTALAGVIHVFKVSPNHSFQLKYCFDIAVQAVENKLLPAVTMIKDVICSQEEIPGGETLLTKLFRTESAEALTETLTRNLVYLIPALFTLAVFAALCVAWWICKELLKRGTKLDVSYMGRLDGYVPGRGVMIVYFVSYLALAMGAEGSVLPILAQNINQILYYVLVYAGFSVLLFVINTRVESKALRAVMVAVLVMCLFAFNSYVSQLLVLIGLFGWNFRKILGGDVLK